MDLSKVLGEMYADDVPAATAPRPTTPEWADDAHLDQAFSNWTPGPPPEAPAAEHEMAAHSGVAVHQRIDDDMAAALTRALSSDQVYPEPVFADYQAVAEAEAVVEPVVVPEPTPEPAPVFGWSRGDDDVLPSTGRRSRRFSRH